MSVRKIKSAYPGLWLPWITFLFLSGLSGVAEFLFVNLIYVCVRATMIGVIVWYLCVIYRMRDELRLRINILREMWRDPSWIEEGKP